MSFRVAVLDAYQQVALSLGAWRQLDASVEVTTLSDHVDDRQQLVNRPAALSTPSWPWAVESYTEHFNQAAEDIASFIRGTPLRVLGPS